MSGAATAADQGAWRRGGRLSQDPERDIQRAFPGAGGSRELRTPLTSIRAFSEMLADGDAAPLTAEQTQFVQRIAAGADQLQRIVEDLLELSRLRSGTEIIQRDAIIIRPFLEDTVRNLYPQAAARDIRLHVRAAD